MSSVNQVLNIIPRISKSQLQGTERRLNGSFKKTANTFQRSMKLATAFFALNLAKQFAGALNAPIDEAKKRMTDLLDSTKSTFEVASSMGSDTGTIRNIEDLGIMQGLGRDEVRSMMASFTQAVRTAQEEKASGKDLSESSQMIEAFTDMKDLGQGFINFITSLSKMTREDRTSLEKGIFGKRQYGLAERFISTDLIAAERKLGQRRELTQATTHLLEQKIDTDYYKALEDRKTFLAAGKESRSPITQALITQEQREQQSFRKKINDTELLKSMADSGQRVTDILSGTQDLTMKMLSILDKTGGWIGDSILKGAEQKKTSKAVISRGRDI